MNERESYIDMRGIIGVNTSPLIYCSSAAFNPFYFKSGFEQKQILDVIINDPVIVVLFKDGDKQKVVAHDGDVFNVEAGIALCILKHVCGGSGNANKILRYWVTKKDKEEAKKKKEDQANAEKRAIKEKQLLKKQAKKKAYKEKKRQEQIDLQAQAYVKALAILNTKDDGK